METYKGSPLVLCRIEGCSRAYLEGQEEMCGLAKVYGILKAPHDPLCGSVATIALWEAKGLLDFWFD